MDEAKSQIVIKEYDANRAALKQALEKLRLLLVEVLSTHGIKYHTVGARLKERESLSKKLARPDVDFADLQDVHDVLGLRIITHFEDEVHTVERLLRSQFDVNEQRSGDRSRLLQPREFGYRSVHVVARLGPDRTPLPEYRAIASSLFEIQVRSILQHAWAEIEHDLGYKLSVAIPTQFRRRFSSIASILELADQVFCELRDGINAYEEEVSRTMQLAPEQVEVNASSLSAFIHSEAGVDLDRRVASELGVKEIVEGDRQHIEQLAARLRDLDVHTIDAIESNIREHAGATSDLAVAWVGTSRQHELPAGIGIFYLLYVLLARLPEDRVFKHLEQFHVGPLGRSEILATRLLAIGRRVGIQRDDRNI